MSPLFIIAFVHCADAGPCQITDVAPYLAYGNYEACISDARLFDVPALRREFGHVQPALTQRRRSDQTRRIWGCSIKNRRAPV